MNNKLYWTLNTFLSFSILAGLQLVNPRREARSPASNEMQPISLEIKHIQLASDSRVQSLQDVQLRVTFNREHVIDLLQGQKINMSAGNMAEINAKFSIDPNWIRNDQLEIKLELVKPGFIDHVVVRCAHVAKKISEFNRAYQCFVPNDSLAILTYRLGNDQVGVSTLAKNP